MNLKNAVAIPVLVGGTAAAGFGVADMVSSGSFDSLSAIKWSSIIVGTGIALFFLVKHKVLTFEAVEEGERAYRRRWGKIVTNRRGKRKVLWPGKKHFYVEKWYDVVVQSVRIRTSPQEPNKNDVRELVFRGTNIWLTLVVYWSVIDVEDDDDEPLYKSLTKVYRVNRAQEGDDALENYVLNRMHSAVARGINGFSPDENGLPVVTLDPEEGTVPTALRTAVAQLAAEVGVVVHDIAAVTSTIAPEERIKQGLSSNESFPGLHV